MDPMIDNSIDNNDYDEDQFGAESLPESSAQETPTLPQNVTTSNQTTICKWKDCGNLYADIDQLVSHIRDDHLGKKKPQNTICLWEGCTRFGQEQNRSALIVHLRQHTGEKPYACPDCDMRFPRPDAVHRHARTVHGKAHVPNISKVGKNNLESLSIELPSDPIASSMTTPAIIAPRSPLPQLQNHPVPALLTTQQLYQQQLQFMQQLQQQQQLQTMRPPIPPLPQTQHQPASPMPNAQFLNIPSFGNIQPQPQQMNQPFHFPFPMNLSSQQHAAIQQQFHQQMLLQQQQQQKSPVGMIMHPLPQHLPSQRQQFPVPLQHPKPPSPIKPVNTQPSSQPAQKPPAKPRQRKSLANNAVPAKSALEIVLEEELMKKRYLEREHEMLLDELETLSKEVKNRKYRNKMLLDVVYEQIYG